MRRGELDLDWPAATVRRGELDLDWPAATAVSLGAPTLTDLRVWSPEDRLQHPPYYNKYMIYMTIFIMSEFVHLSSSSSSSSSCMDSALAKFE